MNYRFKVNTQGHLVISYNRVEQTAQGERFSEGACVVPKDELPALQQVLDQHRSSNQWGSWALVPMTGGHTPIAYGSFGGAYTIYPPQGGGYVGQVCADGARTEADCR